MDGGQAFTIDSRIEARASTAETNAGRYKRHNQMTGRRPKKKTRNREMGHSTACHAAARKEISELKESTLLRDEIELLGPTGRPRCYLPPPGSCLF